MVAYQNIYDSLADFIAGMEAEKLEARSELATATIKVLDLNNINRILERLDLIEAGLFP